MRFSFRANSRLIFSFLDSRIHLAQRRRCTSKIRSRSVCLTREQFQLPARRLPTPLEVMMSLFFWLIYGPTLQPIPRTRPSALADRPQV